MNAAIDSGGESTLAGSPPGSAPIAERTGPADAFGSDGPSGAAAAPEAEDAPAPVIVQRYGFLQAFQSLLNVIVVALFIITFTVQPFRIPSASMEPTLLIGDFMLVDKQVGPETPPRIFAPASAIHRGDLIIFHYPVDSSLHLVKRVIGLPGDRLHLRDGHVYINGNVLPEPYAVYRPSPPDSYRDDFPRLVSADPGVDSRWWIEMHRLVSQGELTVPQDNYFVLGDNRNNSEDSRYWGFVPGDAIVGKPFLVYFSLNDSRSAAGRTSAAAMAGSGPARTNSLANFARWDRAMHIVR